MNTRISLITLVWSCSIVLCLGQTDGQEFDRKGELPPEVLKVYRAAKTARLFSLEPTKDVLPKDDRFHEYKVLGETTLNWEQTVAALGVVQKGVAISQATGAFCFAPRHGLRVSNGEHFYDLLLCFECGWVYVFRDNERLTDLALAASPEYFNALLKAGRVPLSKSSGEMLAKEEKYYSDRKARWMSAMPESIRLVWADWQAEGEKGDLKKLQVPLAKQFPKAEDRILALFAWYAQDDDWASDLHYASAPELMLEQYSDADFVTVGQRDDLTTAQFEGAARYLIGWPTTRLAVLPAKLKQKLLAHVTNQKDAQKIAWARHAFGQK